MSKSEYTDEQLILSFQGGDVNSFNEIVYRYKDKLLNYVNGYMHDINVSENLVQDTFMKVYTHGNSYKEIAKFSTWIYTIAGNLAKTELRKLKRRKTFTFSQLSHQDNEFNLERVQFNRGNNENNENRENETYVAVREAIPKLPEDYRNIIILRDIQELSYDEISNITKLALGTVKSRINRARLKLRDIVKENRR